MKWRFFTIFAGLAFIALDQWIKIVALVYLNSSYYKVGNEMLGLAFELSLNSGAFLSLGAGLPALLKQAIFVVCACVCLGWTVYWIVSRWGIALKSAIPLYAIVLGGMSNLIDRFFRDGHVVDYLVFNVGPLHTGVFNLADIAITGGAIFLLVDMCVKPRAS
ncbi:signal peptidase II [Pseudomonas sp. S75]|nr:signal peptidase II [Pseudomonas sp. S30]MBK0156290.1 signal peptidase II [Pseudomonas sp. S75]